MNARRQPDIHGAKHSLGWEFSAGLRDGFLPTIDFFKHVLSRPAQA